MRYYDEEFKPWQIVDGQCVVADEIAWGKLTKLDISTDIFNMLHDAPARPIIKVPTDIFEDVEGPIVDSKFRPLHIYDPWESPTHAGPGGSPWEYLRHEEQSKDPMGIEFVLSRTFQTVDSTPHVDYLLMTQRPELVRKKWPKWVDRNPYQRPGVLRSRELKNVILATYVETQADIERLVSDLLKCHDLCKGLSVVCNPKEKLDFREVKLIPGDERFNVIKGIMIDSCGGIHPMDRSLNLIIAEGNEHPMHPDHVKSLRDQCLDANVKFNFASWGDWAPRTTHEESLTGQEQHTAFIDGMPGDKFPEDYRMVNWGREHSGRLLDGQEHNGRIS